MDKIHIKATSEISLDRVEEAWQLYQDCFAELNKLTVQRHLMTRPEFDVTAIDVTVSKYLAFDEDDRLVGLATITNVLSSMPLISPAYFQHRWRDLYERRQIWYVGFVAVLPGNAGAFAELIRMMTVEAHEVGGIIGIDCCQVNAERRLPQVTARILHRLYGDCPPAERADRQEFWFYPFPTGDPS